MLQHQCDRFLAFATGNSGLGVATGQSRWRCSRNERIDPLFYEATEAAIVSALLAGETMIDRDGVTARALELLVSASRKTRRIARTA